MSSENTNYFTKENLDEYLKELGREYRRLMGKSMPAEIILIGGAAIIANYGFRDMTTDVDAIIRAASSMKDVINRVGDKFNLPNGWLNARFYAHWLLLSETYGILCKIQAVFQCIGGTYSISRISCCNEALFRKEIQEGLIRYHWDPL